MGCDGAGGRLPAAKDRRRGRRVHDHEAGVVAAVVPSQAPPPGADPSLALGASGAVATKKEE